MTDYAGNETPPPFAPEATSSDHDHIADLTKYERQGYSVRGWGFVPDDAQRIAAPILHADVIGSQIKGTDLHTVMLDLDVPARLVPSTTPGHSHLYIDVPMTWDHYADLLRALGAARVIETGYANISIKRRQSFLRLPWVKKVNDQGAKYDMPF